MADKQEEYLTVEEARIELDVSSWRMSEWIRRNVLKTIKSPWDGRVKLIRRSDIERLKREPRPHHEYAA